jgi:gliding motility-associated-like protein
MKLKALLFLFIAIFFTSNIAFSQLLVNKGAIIKVTKGVSVYVDGAVQNDAGTIDVDNISGISELIVKSNFVNNATAQGSGYYKIYGNWINNNTFTAGTGTVFLEGANQLLSGTSSTTFHNLTLNGSGVKTLGIDQTCTGVLSLNNLELSTLNYKFFVTNSATNSITRTTGFVSSTNGGFLSRTTNTNGVYLFPVGSSSGTNRYRPVEIQPNNSSANTYTVRLANVNPTSETYNVDLLANDICEVNSNFYHQINRTSGSTSANLSIYYDNSADGSWNGIANWGTSPNQWNIVTGSSTASGSPMYKAIVSNWNTFSNIPYSLYKVAPNVNATSNSPICEGGTIQLNEIGGEAVSWAWSGPNGFTSSSKNPIISGASTLAHGTYYVTITSANSCQAVGSVSVTVNPNPNASITPATVSICDGSSTALTASGGGTYSWSGGLGSNASVTVSPSATTTYTVTVTSGVGCTATASSTVTVNALPTITASSNSPVCQGQTINLTATGSGGSTYAWSGPDSFTASTPNPTITNAQTSHGGTYTVTLTNSGTGCSASANTSITVNPLPTITASSNSPVCQSQTINLTATGTDGTNYSWSGPASYTSNAPNPTITNAQTSHGGTYTVTLTNSGTGCSASASTSVTVNAQPSSPLFTIDCTAGEGNGIITITSPLGVNYTYSIDGTFQTDPEFGPLANGDYQITVTDSNTGCSNTSAEIDLDCGCYSPTNLTLSASSGGICEYETLSLSGNTFGGSATEVNLTHNGNGSLTNTNFTNSPFTIEYTPATGDIGNTVTITVTTNNPEGLPCTPSVKTFALSVNAKPNVNLSSNSPVCQNETLNLYETGGEAASWTWTGPNSFSSNIQNPTRANMQVSDAGTYTVVITDIHSCTNTSDISISVNTIPIINIDDIDPLCEGENINLTETGGDAISWDWTGPNGFTSTDQNPEITNANTSNSGSYYLSITDINSCTNSANTSITVNANPTANIEPASIAICEGESTELVASGDGTYAWSHSSETSASVTVNPITETTYTVTVTNTNNCSASASSTVSVNQNPDIPTANIDCISGLGQITITSPLGADYEYSIGSSFQANTIFENLDNGNYTIIVNNVNTNCSSVSEVLTIDCGCTNEPSLTLSENTGEICGNQAFTLDGNSFGGSATQVNITHNGSGEIDETNITSSDFSFTYTPSSEDYGNTVIITIITDNPQGEPCQVASATFSLDVLDIPNIIANNSSPICKGEDIDLTESGNEAISWSWTGPNGFNSDMQNPTITEADVFANGTYTVTGTDAKGCTNSATTIVIVSIPTEITFVEYLCADTLPIFLNANIQGGTWSGNGIIDANTGEFDPEIAGDGEHTITYTLLNPCGNTTTTTIRVYPRANAEILPVDTLFLSDLPIFVETVEAGGIWSGTAIDEIIGEFTPNIAGIGDHQVFYTIEEPCGDIDSTIIIVIPDIIPDLLIPDVLTPNNDGYNDTWRIQGIQAFEKIEIYIFNRWGDEVFTYTGSGFDYHDPAKQWDGTYKGKLLPFGTYVYVLILENDTSYKGTISLIR